MSTNTSARAARYIAALALFSFVALAMAQPAAPTGPQQVTLTLDRDLITFVQAAVWAGGIFLAIFAVLAVGFFGFDVRAARKSLLEASEDIRTRMESIRKDHEALSALKERLEKLGGELVGLIEEKTPSPNSIPTTGAKRGRKPKADKEDIETDIDLSDIEVDQADDEPAVVPDENHRAFPATKSTPSRPTKGAGEAPDSDSMYTAPNGRRLSWEEVELFRTSIRKVIAESEFQWSTLGTIAKKTGLPPELVLNLAYQDPFIRPGEGHSGPIFTIAGERAHWMLWNHAARGKEPVEKGTLFG